MSAIYGIINHDVDSFAPRAFFSTLTNVNFDSPRIVGYAREAIALREAVRVAANFVIVSVPSKKDSNPDHIHLFAADDLENMLLESGARRVSFAHVPNHTIAIANVGDR